MPISKTLEKFGYPNTLIKEYRHWCLLLRPKQATLGSLVLVCKEPVAKFSEISAESFQEYTQIVPEVEKALYRTFPYNKINYLTLMMVDPDVHTHIIPRHEQPLRFEGKEYRDFDWPGMPTLQKVNELSGVDFRKLHGVLMEKLLGLPSGPRRFKRVYTTGCFDMFHTGHLNILRRSKEIADYLIVGISTDELMEQEKGKRPVMAYEKRAEIVAAVRYVDEVVPQVDKNKQKIVTQYQIDAITVGDDWNGKYPPVSCEVVYFPYTTEVSSTALEAKIREL